VHYQAWPLVIPAAKQFLSRQWIRQLQNYDKQSLAINNQSGTFWFVESAQLGFDWLPSVDSNQVAGLQQANLVSNPASTNNRLDRKPS
jgi:hypothetical protein